MASIHETPSPLEENDEYYYDEEIVPSSSSCGCLWGLCGRSNFGAQRYLLQQQQQGSVVDHAKENWVVETVKKVREFSEVVAGPKWKNFIRSFSTIYKKINNKVQFQYDPQSYALNFDDGGIDRDAEAVSYLHFSNSGYAAAAAPPGISNAKF